MPTYSEREIEDWVCENPVEVWSGAYIYVEVAGRQVTLPSGRRLDVLLLVLDRDHLWRLVVVEIKACATDYAALVQLTDYVREVRTLAHPKDRVSGVLLAPSHPNELHTLRSAMPGIHFATFWPHVMFDGVLDYSENVEVGSQPGALRAWSERSVAFNDGLRDAARRIHKRRRRAALVPIDDAPHRMYRTLRIRARLFDGHLPEVAEATA